MFSSILVAVDILDPDFAAVAFERARRMAERDSARLTVISVVPAWPDDLAKVPGDYKPRLEAWIDRRRGDTEVTPLVRVGGSISGRIMEVVSETGADLVVMASHNPRMTDYLIGSNAAHVALHAPCSVLVHRAAEGAGPVPPNHVVVPVDLDNSGVAAKAMAIGQRIARTDEARLTALSIVPMIEDGMSGGPPDYQSMLEEYVAGIDGDPEPRGELRIAPSVSGEIRIFAQENDVDLIVMASHEPRLSDYVIGSNAAHVALHTPCSVMVVR